MVASVPLEVKRIRSIEGTIATISSANSLSASVGAPNELPRVAAAAIALTTLGWACPSISGPHEST